MSDRTLRLDDDQREGVRWAIERGLHELRNDGFPNADPAKSNIPILESVLAALSGSEEEGGQSRGEGLSGTATLPSGEEVGAGTPESPPGGPAESLPPSPIPEATGRCSCGGGAALYPDQHRGRRIDPDCPVHGSPIPGEREDPWKGFMP